MRRASRRLVGPGRRELASFGRRSPSVYRQLRTTIVGAWAIAVPIFATFPVAPPRQAGLGLDDHPAIRAGLEALVAAEADLQLVGTSAGEDELWALLRLERPDVLVLDMHHPGRDGLEVCLEIKRRPAAPAIVLYTAWVDETLTVAAALAGADAVVGKSRRAATLLEAIRCVAPPSSTPTESPAEIARTLGLQPDAVTDRIAAIIAELEPLRSAA